jgi:hypothetical protein
MAIRFLMAAGIMLLATPEAFAQGQPQVSDVHTKLRSGEPIQVVDIHRAIIRGRFDGVSSSALRVRVKGDLVEIPEPQIYQVRKQRHEPDGVLIGLGIGAAVGLTFVNVSCKGSSEHSDCMRAGSLVIAPPFAAAGALIDWRFARYVTIFERRASPTSRFQLWPLMAGGRAGVALTVAF